MPPTAAFSRSPLMGFWWTGGHRELGVLLKGETKLDAGHPPPPPLCGFPKCRSHFLALGHHPRQVPLQKFESKAGIKGACACVLMGWVEPDAERTSFIH